MQAKCLSLQGIKTHAQQRLPGSGGGGGGSSATTDAASLLAMERVVMRPLRRPWLLAVFRPRGVFCSLPSSSSPSHFSLSLLMSLRRQRWGIKALLHTELNPNIFSDGQSEQNRVTNADTVSICEFLTCYDVLVFHNRSSHRSQNHFCTVLCVHRKVKNPVFFHN